MNHNKTFKPVLLAAADETWRHLPPLQPGDARRKREQLVTQAGIHHSFNDKRRSK